MSSPGPHGDAGKILLPHLDAAYNLARWLVREPSVAEGVVQDAYGRACRSLTSLRGRSCRTWLLRIVRNAAYSALEAPRPTGVLTLGMGTQSVHGFTSVDLDTMPNARTGAEAVPVEPQDVDRLNAALEALPVGWRECLVLRDLEALGYSEMAQVLDVPVEAVVSRLACAREALQRELFGETAEVTSE